MKNGYCIVISKYRLYQGLALYNSIKLYSNDFNMFVLCMDNETYEIMKRLKLEHVTLITLSDIEDEQLKRIKKERTFSEYCYTIKPWLLLYVLNKHLDIERVCYVDSDIYFYADPDRMFSGYDACSVLISRHDYTIDNEIQSNKTGKYNSGLCSFNRDKIGCACLEWWKQRCENWCFLKIEEDKFTDQKYLEDFPVIFNRVCEFNHPGVNVAFWNHGGREIKKQNDKYLINDTELICYHFSNFRMLSEDEYVLNYGHYIHLDLHKPYSIAVREAIYQVNAIGGNEIYKCLLEDGLKDDVHAVRYKIEA